MHLKTVLTSYIITNSNININCINSHDLFSTKYLKNFANYFNAVRKFCCHNSLLTTKLCQKSNADEIFYNKQGLRDKKVHIIVFLKVLDTFNKC